VRSDEECWKEVTTSGRGGVLAMPAEVVLTLTEGPGKGRTLHLSVRGTFTVGRHPDSHIVLNEPSVSRHHFIIQVDPPDAQLRDLGSGIGTYVNGTRFGGPSEAPSTEPQCERVSYDVAIHDGDEISVGIFKLSVRVHAPPTCCHCNAEIATAVSGSVWLHGTYLCLGCQERLRTKPIPLLPVTAIACLHCGKNVASEVAVRPGNHVCKECREQLLSENAGPEYLLNLALAANTPKPDIAGYLIHEELGSGGMGRVYRAERIADKKHVAIKVMLAQAVVHENARQRFQREIHMTKSLRHPNVVAYLDNGTYGATFYFVQEYCNGGDLATLAAHNGGTLPTRHVVAIMKDCLLGLKYTHDAGNVHRDLKPQNILLHQQRGMWTAKIADFGLARSFATSGLVVLTATGATAGTLSYMPREQLEDFKRVTPVSDVWSIGATFYHVLTGHFPRETGKVSDPLQVILNQDAVPIRKYKPALSLALAHIFDRTLKTDPNDRYQNAGELLRALEMV